MYRTGNNYRVSLHIEYFFDTAYQYETKEIFHNKIFAKQRNRCVEKEKNLKTLLVMLCTTLTQSVLIACICPDSFIRCSVSLNGHLKLLKNSECEESETNNRKSKVR